MGMKSKSIVPTGGVPKCIQEEHIQRVVNAVNNATAYEWLAGFMWYPVYSELIANESHLPRQTAIGLFAVLSPQRYIHLNWAIYLQSMSVDPWELKAMFPERFKVAGILGTDDPESYISGDKVEAFYANLSGDYNRVTVDRHAISLALNQHITGGVDTPMYKYIELVYQLAAARLGLSPAVTQAIAWVHHRNNKGIENKDYNYTAQLNQLLSYIITRIHMAKNHGVYEYSERMAA